MDTLEPLGNEFGAAGVRCFVSACNDTLPQCRARLEAAHGQRVKPRMDVLDELAGVGQDGQPVVLSASQLLHIAKYKDLYCLRRSLMTDTGLPVAMLAPHPTHKRKHYADGLLFTLNTPGAAARLLAHEHVVLGTAAAAAPAVTATAADIRRMMRGDLNNANARRRLLAALIGTSDAACMLKLSVDTVEAAMARAEAVAATSVAAWEAHLLAECIHDGVTDISDASAVTLARARRHFAAALARAPARDPLLVFQGAADVFSARCRSALDWVLLHFGRESPYQTVKVGCSCMPRIDLTATPEVLWREYEAYMERRGDKALSRSSFLRHVILPQMRLYSRRTCLCSHCEDGKDAINALLELLSAPNVPDEPDTTAADGLLALRARVITLPAQLYEYSIAVAAQLDDDLIDLGTFTGKLRFDDLLALPVASLDGLNDAIDATALMTSDPATIEEWLASMRKHASELEAYKRHLLGRAWQNVRQRQKHSLLKDKFDAGIRAVRVIIDFKAKQPKKRELRERQSEFFNNSSISIFGVVLIWWDGTSLQREYLDFVSDDTVQDAVWTANVFQELTKDLAQLSFTEVHVDSDNAYHFHNNYVFSHIAFAFVRALRLRGFTWQFCEPGEGKDEADGHFGARTRASVCAHALCHTQWCCSGVLTKAFDEYLALYKVIDGVDDYVKIISRLSSGLNVKARVITIDRSGFDTTRWKWQSISSYKEFVLRSEWLTFADDCASPEELMRGSWSVRDYTGNGSPLPLSAGAFTTGWLPVSPEDGVELLTAALQRPGNNGAPGQSRMALLPKLIGVGGLITDSSRFGGKSTEEYTNALFVLRHLLTHGYTAAERTAAAVGGQLTPHTLAAAIVQVEARRRLAATSASAAAAAAAAAATTRAASATSVSASAAAAAAAAAGGDVVAAAGGAIAAPAGSARASRLAFTNGTSAPLGAAGVAPQPLLGRTVGGLSADALSRVRAAVAAAGEGASPVEVARIASATLRAVMEDVPTHVDELPARGEEPVCDYGDF